MHAASVTYSRILRMLRHRAVQGTIMEGKTPNQPLTPAQKQLVKRQLELEHWKKHSKQLRSRNVITGLAIGAFVVGLFSYTILSVKQEKIMDGIDEEAKIVIMKGPRTGANS